MLNEKIKLIIEKINNTKVLKNNYTRTSKDRLIKLYTETNKNKLDLISIEKIKKHNFHNEIVTGSHRLHKIDELKKVVTKYEFHKYAPELNCLHFKSGKMFKINAMVKPNMEDALIYASLHLTLEDINYYAN